MASGTLDELCDFLASNVSTVALVRGTNLFRSKMTDTPDVQVAALNYEVGEEAEVEFGKTDGYGRENVRVQFRARGTQGDFDTPNAILHEIRQDVIVLFPGTLGSTVYEVAKPSSPYVLERDENERVICAMNVRFRKEPS